MKDTPRALDFMVTKEAEKLYTEMGIFTKEELHARHEIALENYTMKLQIESRVTADMAISQIIPAAISYQSELLDNAMSLQDLLGPKAPCRTQLEMINSIGKLIDELSENAEKMRQERKKANALTDSKKKAVAYCDKVKPLMDAVRDKVDRLELIVDDELWPLPKLRELLFTR